MFPLPASLFFILYSIHTTINKNTMATTVKQQRTARRKKLISKWFREWNKMASGKMYNSEQMFMDDMEKALVKAKLHISSNRGTGK